MTSGFVSLLRFFRGRLPVSARLRGINYGVPGSGRRGGSPASLLMQMGGRFLTRVLTAQNLLLTPRKIAFEGGPGRRGNRYQALSGEGASEDEYETYPYDENESSALLHGPRRRLREGGGRLRLGLRPSIAS